MYSLRNEFKKIMTLRTLICLILLFIGINVCYYFMNKPVSPDHWRAEANQQLKSDKDLVRELEKNNRKDEVDFKFIAQYKNEMKLIEYSLKNDIVYGNISVWSQFLNISKAGSLVGLILIALGAKVIYGEYESKTWKNILMNGESRSRNLINKYIYTAAQSAIGILVFILVTFIYGSIFYRGIFQTNRLEIVDQKIQEISYIPDLFTTFFLLFVKIIFVTFFAQGLIIFIQKSKLSLVFSLFLFLFAGMIESRISGNILDKFLPFRYLSYSTIDDVKTGIVCCMVLICYTIAWLTSATFIFKNRDIA